VRFSCATSSDEQVQNFAKFIEVSSDSFENADRGFCDYRVRNNMATTEAQVLAAEIQKVLQFMKHLLKAF
jgi:hypothetical protein